MYRVEADLDYLYGMSDDACFSSVVHMHECIGLVPRNWMAAVTVKRYKDNRDYELRRKMYRSAELRYKKQAKEMYEEKPLF